jgi:hypothetical protein
MDDLIASAAVLQGIAQTLSMKQTNFLNNTGLHPRYTTASYLKNDPMVQELFDLGDSQVSGFKERWSNVVESSSYGPSKPVMHMTGKFLHVVLHCQIYILNLVFKILQATRLL